MRTVIKTLALFGTSADPPTRGHQAILVWLSQQFDQVVVWASDNPFKIHEASLEQRQEMLQRLVAEVDAPEKKIVLAPELSHPRALTTLERARQHWPSAQLIFVIGSDLVPKLPSWYRIPEVFSQVQLLVIPRPGYPLHSADLNTLRELGGQIAIAGFTGPAVSSSAYRETDNPDPLTPAIQTYIQEERLYEWAEVASSTRSSPGINSTPGDV